MRHFKKGRKFGRERKVRRAFLRNLEAHFLLHGKMKTTLARAKELRPIVEKHITVAKKATVAVRRNLARALPPRAVKILVDDVAPRFQSRPGGYTRINRLGQRKSDGAPLALIEFV